MGDASKFLKPAGREASRLSAVGAVWRVLGSVTGATVLLARWKRKTALTGDPSPIRAVRPEEKQVQGGDPSTVLSPAKAETSPVKTPRCLHLLSKLLQRQRAPQSPLRSRSFPTN